MTAFYSIAVYVCLGLCSFLSFAYAQQNSIPDDVSRKLFKDLEQLQEIANQAYSAYEAEMPTISKTLPTRNLNTLEVTSQAALKYGASISAKTLRIVKPGTKLSVLGQAGEWFAVDLRDINHVEEKYGEKGTAWISAKNVTPKSVTKPLNVGVQVLQEKMLSQVLEMRKAYEKNSYIRITGFSVSLIPPSVALNFDFK